MKIVVDIILGIFIILGTYMGARRGLIKSLISLIGLVAVIIISYTLSTKLTVFLVDHMPFFNFGGNLSGLTSLNILIYNILSFVVVFVVLYSILNVVISVTGFIDTLLKFTVIWVIPSKIGGALVGFLETWIYLFLVLFVLSQFSLTNNLIKDGKISSTILNHTPVVGTYLSGAKNAAMEIYELVDQINNENKDPKELNLKILQVEINWRLITKQKANELIETGKLKLDNVMFGKGLSSWLNI